MNLFKTWKSILGDWKIFRKISRNTIELKEAGAPVRILSSEDGRLFQQPATGSRDAEARRRVQGEQHHRQHDVDQYVGALVGCPALDGALPQHRLAGRGLRHQVFAGYITLMRIV